MDVKVAPGPSSNIPPPKSRYNAKQGLELSYVSDYESAGFDPDYGCDFSATLSPLGPELVSYWFPWSSTRFVQTVLRYRNPPEPGKGIYEVVKSYRYILNGGGDKNSGGDVAIDPFNKVRTWLAAWGDDCAHEAGASLEPCHYHILNRNIYIPILLPINRLSTTRRRRALSSASMWHP